MEGKKWDIWFAINVGEPMNSKKENPLMTLISVSAVEN